MEELSLHNLPIDHRKANFEHKLWEAKYLKNRENKSDPDAGTKHNQTNSERRVMTSSCWKTNMNTMRATAIKRLLKLPFLETINQFRLSRLWIA